jgi:hypothetical protein
MVMELCVFCGEEWDDLLDGYAIIGTKSFHACFDCLIGGKWEEHEVEDVHG